MGYTVFSLEFFSLPFFPGVGSAGTGPADFGVGSSDSLMEQA
jgi:hypothetical protein